MKNKVDRYFLTALAVTVMCSFWFEYQQKSARETKTDVVQTAWEESGSMLTGSLHESRPDFAAIKDVKEKKQLFFAFIRNMIETENTRLLAIRSRVLDYQQKATLNQDEQEWLLETAKRFRIKHSGEVTPALFYELLLKVDAIPPSLAMVQAANESAWGTSRFALEANNYFGQWCFTKNCGLVPAERPEGATYEVRKFDSPEASVRSYMNNLNTSSHYSALREMRAKCRVMGESVTGAILAHGLFAYSQRGHAYVEELVAMINSNNLTQYDLNKPLPEL